MLNDMKDYGDLPEPEEISKGMDRTFVQSLEGILGEYRVRCFLSSNWLLRDAVLTKTSMMIEQHTDFIQEPGEKGTSGVRNETTCKDIASEARERDARHSTSCRVARRFARRFAPRPTLSPQQNSREGQRDINPCY